MPAVGGEVGSVDAWFAEHRVTEIECLVADLSGIARGKILPSAKFLGSFRGRELRLPESIFAQTVTGECPEGAYDVIDPAEIDIYLRPDPTTLRMVPWYGEPTAQVIADCHYADGRPVDIAPRSVLRRVVEHYRERGWQPIVAPELEFFLVKVNTDPDYPLEPPIGRSGRRETGRQQYGVDAVNEFEPLFEDIYAFCAAQDVDIDTLSHEVGAAQFEINFRHGDPLGLADQVFLFKRIVREAAMRREVYATFMAKPIQGEQGSAMHVHQNIVDAASGRNLFADGESDSEMFRYYIGGLQTYLMDAMPLMAPNVNSYRRLVPDSDAPTNLNWGPDNRTVGLRVPVSEPEARRVENRLAGADGNPYLVMAASLACGLLGIEERRVPSPPVTGSGYKLPYTLPRHLPDAIARLHGSEPLRRLLGERFVEVLCHVKSAEWNGYQHVISSWERENLLLNV